MQGQGMRSAEVLIWLGDFNYRVNMDYEDTLDYIKNNWLDKLLEKVEFYVLFGVSACW